ncbi:hypothetical protein [Methylovulum psychrotolerans]|uniref:hypothetical protein n=1 Tax=Methylovulum psychrotolerans TaxID=1704499 RepID=UPI0012F964C9|nr:hypothetical protein [Methylovulum psychrotolerans]
MPIYTYNLARGGSGGYTTNGNGGNGGNAVSTTVVNSAMSVPPGANIINELNRSQNDAQGGDGGVAG